MSLLYAQKEGKVVYFGFLGNVQEEGKEKRN